MLNPPSQYVSSTTVIESQRDVRQVNSRHIDSSAVTRTHTGGFIKKKWSSTISARARLSVKTTASWWQHKLFITVSFLLDFKKEKNTLFLFHFFFSKQENIPQLMMAAVPFDVIWDAGVKTDWFPWRWTVVHYLWDSFARTHTDTHSETLAGYKQISQTIFLWRAVSQSHMNRHTCQK